MQQLPHETIEHKARHFVSWHPTLVARLAAFNAMADWASHFNPQWKVANMVENITTLFALLNKHNARYLVMGGFAAVIYGVPRFTDDVDFFIEGTEENITNTINALIDFGSDQAQVFKTMRSTIVKFIEFDDLPVKADIMVQTPGLVWESAWANRNVQSYQGQTFYALSRADLISAKRAAGRWQDIEDVKALESIEEDDNRTSDNAP